MWHRIENMCQISLKMKLCRFKDFIGDFVFLWQSKVSIFGFTKKGFNFWNRVHGQRRTWIWVQGEKSSGSSSHILELQKHENRWSPKCRSRSNTRISDRPARNSLRSSPPDATAICAEGTASTMVSAMRLSSYLFLSGRWAVERFMGTDYVCRLPVCKKRELGGLTEIQTDFKL